LEPPNVDVLRAVLTGSVSVSALLIAVITFLLDQYDKVRTSDTLKKPYTHLIWLTLVNLKSGVIACSLSLVSLLMKVENSLYLWVSWGSVAVFVFLLISIVVECTWMTRKVMG